MRFANVVLGLGVFAIALPAALTAGCSSSDSSTSTGGTSSGGTSGNPCHNGGTTCKAAKTDCLGLEDNSAKKTEVGLRIGQLTIAKPDALKTGAVKLIVDKGVSMNLTGSQYSGDPSTSCNVNGNGTFNWLLDFDLTAGKLKTGGAKPLGDPHAGYCFVNQTIAGLNVTPTTLDAKVGTDGSFAVTAGLDLIVPIFLDAQATKQVLLPLHNVTFSGAKLSADHNCIGTYNGDEFTATNLCLPDGTTTPPQTFFTNAAALDAYISVEEADGVIEPTTGQSLCVLFSGNAAMYGNGAKPNLCKRDAMNKIVLQGDWCIASKDKATATCADAFQMSAAFSASSVKITGNCP